MRRRKESTSNRGESRGFSDSSSSLDYRKRERPLPRGIPKGLDMNVLIHDDQPLEKWREGVMTRMRVSALLGGRQLCIFDQFCDPGLPVDRPVRRR